jgi:hypothetical protein
VQRKTTLPGFKSGFSRISVLYPAEYQNEEMSFTEPCFRSVDVKLMGSGLSWFRIDDVLAFSVNTKLLLFETPISREERGNYLAF